MSKVISLRTYRIAVIVCALCGGLLGYKVGSGISQAELDAKYEQGYKDASWFVTYDIETNPTVVVDNLGRTWYRIDFTDTMPAVEKWHWYSAPAVDSVDTLEAREK